MSEQTQELTASLESGSGHALEAIERASIDMQIATAKRYPRTLSKVKADMLCFATLDEETASACFYTLPRGGKTIQGPSVRLAEIAVASYGNLRAGSRVIETVVKGDQPHVVVQAVAHDLEKNTAITIEKRRRIVGKKRNEGRVDEDDINLACNACSAIAFRDAVFKIIPQALIRPVYEQCKQVAVGNVKSLVHTRFKVVERLRQMGVTDPRILAVVEARKIEDIDQSKLEILIGLGTAIRDGDTTIEEAFPDVQQSQPKTESKLGEAPKKEEAAPIEKSADEAAGLAPEQKPAAADSLAKPSGPQMGELQQQLSEIVLEAGGTYDDFRKFAEEQFGTGNKDLGVLAWDSYAGFEDITDRFARRMIGAKTGLQMAIRKMKEGK